MTPDLFSLASAAVAERLVLLLNHVLSGEPQATQRMLPHLGRSVVLRLRTSVAPASKLPPLVMRITPAGMFERVEDESVDPPGLSVVVDGNDPRSAFIRLLSGRGPRVDIEGDAGFAADVSWLLDNLRWTPLDELSSLVGHAPAGELARIGRTATMTAGRFGTWASSALAQLIAAGPEHGNEA
jgi:ubiquinone biosynthesis protein UbiJ